MALEQVSTYVSRRVKKQWESFARQHRMTVASMLRTVMGRVVDQDAPILEQPQDATTNADLHLRLNSHENEALWEAARRHGMNRQGYLIGFIRANAQGLPTATPEELAALRECNQQLLHIGRNLNQIARAVNADGPQLPGLAPHVLARLLEQVKATHSATTALVQRTLGRWTRREPEEGDAA